MSNKLKLLLMVFSIVITSDLFAQCTMGTPYSYTFDSSTLTVGNRTSMICCLWGNEYFEISNIVAGNIYTFDNCGAGYDSEITLFDPNNDPVAFDSGNCSTGDDGIIPSFLANMSGTYKIQTNLAGCSNIAANTEMFITLDATLSNEQVFKTKTISLYPNPVTNSFTINTNLEIENVHVVNLEGKVVKRFNNQSTTYNIEALTSGMYFLNIQSNKGVITKKIMVK